MANLPPALLFLFLGITTLSVTCRSGWAQLVHAKKTYHAGRSQCLQSTMQAQEGHFRHWQVLMLQILTLSKQPQ
ncbi:uncharacterized protein EDB91DRAFT_1099228 [Suillus paluster]|uniref:uncharacterized protein n=1 Tax=Suillus paluster TaxID=48578 RepID=UPI001B87059F|nr:uncharacterized protein EDB91DRAFT_1099228 [Suillus paluster]KAG1753669.1 hypothetical protein EDB91DRAFT_1099228 [Suillus paluster]